MLIQMIHCLLMHLSLLCPTSPRWGLGEADLHMGRSLDKRLVYPPNTSMINCADFVCTSNKNTCGLARKVMRNATYRIYCATSSLVHAFHNTVLGEWNETTSRQSHAKQAIKLVNLTGRHEHICLSSLHWSPGSSLVPLCKHTHLWQIWGSDRALSSLDT